MTIDGLRVWLQHRINYWEDVCEEYAEVDGESAEMLMDIGRYKGTLDAFQQLDEFLRGQRR